jgi:hypothetical protein
MRRSALGSILFGLALLVQFFAPEMVTRAQAFADSADPFIICAHLAADAAPEVPSAPLQKHQAHTHCLLCQISTGGLALLATAIAFTWVQWPSDRQSAWELQRRPDRNHDWPKPHDGNAGILRQ